MTDAFQTASIVMAAGRGSRMKAYDGNKTLLPLIPEKESPYKGGRPILLHILEILPRGPRAVVVNYRSEDVQAATQNMELTYCRQPELNGTGGALLATREFIEGLTCDRVIITMGDVPFVKAETYGHLLEKLADHHMVVLGFQPEDRKHYGILEISGDRVEKITEWKYWRDYPRERMEALETCNSGIYAVRKDVIVKYLPVLESRPQIVHKERNGQMVAVQEYFITDLVEYMNADGLSVGVALTEDETETMGVDDLEALQRAQRHYTAKYRLNAVSLR